MTSYANAIEEEIAKLNEKMSKLQTQKVEEETQKEEAKKNEKKEEEKQKQNEKREEEMSKEAIEYEDMMIIQKVYPKFFTITTKWNKTAIRNPEYEKYYNEISKKIKEFLNNSGWPTLEQVYSTCYDNSSMNRGTYVPNLSQCTFTRFKCPNCSKQFTSCEQILTHMENTFDQKKFENYPYSGSMKQRVRKIRQHQQQLELDGQNICRGRYHVNISTQQVTEKSVLESTEYYRVLNELKKICIEPPPLYLGRLEGSSSPKYIYDDVIVDKTVDMDTNISVFIDNNPEYSVIPIHEHKYMIQKQ